MIETMHDMNGAGIAAPQIGEPWRVFVVHGTGDNPRYPYKPAVPLTVFVNPTIEVIEDDPMYMIEGCLSIPGMRGRVRRNCKVRCRAQTVDGTWFTLRAEGHVAGTLQHEQDHLDGQLFTDITDDGLMTWDAFEKYHKEAFFRYADEINVTYPTPIVWEDNGPDVIDHGCEHLLQQLLQQTNRSTHESASVAAVSAAAAAAAAAVVVVDPLPNPAATSIYAPELCWTGSTFERDVQVSVDQGTGRITKVTTGTDDNSSDDRLVVPLDGCALTPGFVNAHSHAFQRGLRGRGEKYPVRSEHQEEGEAPPSFWTWRDAMYGLVEEFSNDKEAFQEQTLQCFEEMANAGITTVGEFHYFRHGPNTANNSNNYEYDRLVVEAAREANVRIVLLNAWYERGGFDGSPLGPSQQQFQSTDTETYWEQMDRIQTHLDTTRGNSLGAVVHSLRAASVDSIASISLEADKRNMQVHVHLEEQQKEIDDCLAVHGMRPLDLLLDTVPTEQLKRFVAVHCTHSEPEALSKFVKAGGGVNICPLTEASLGDGILRAPEATSGVVSLGTDCNARIDMFEEMRWLEYTQRLAKQRRGVYTSLTDEHDGDVASLLMECATIHGATHLGVETGRVEVGQWADFALLDLKAPALRGVQDEHMMGAMILGGSGEGLCLDTCMAGKWTKRVRTIVRM